VLGGRQALVALGDQTPMLTLAHRVTASLSIRPSGKGVMDDLALR